MQKLSKNAIVYANSTKIAHLKEFLPGHTGPILHRPISGPQRYCQMSILYNCSAQSGRKLQPSQKFVYYLIFGIFNEYLAPRGVNKINFDIWSRNTFLDLQKSSGNLYKTEFCYKAKSTDLNWSFGRLLSDWIVMFSHQIEPLKEHI